MRASLVREVHAVLGNLSAGDSSLLLDGADETLHLTRDVVPVHRRSVIGRVRYEGTNEPASEGSSDGDTPISYSEGMTSSRSVLTLKNYADTS
jgi:hypothetical protein